MQDEYVFKVRVVDFINQDGPGDQIPEALGLVNKFRNKVEDNISGMICIDHVHLPQVSCSLENPSWVLSIFCCCEAQCSDVRTRIRGILS